MSLTSNLLILIITGILTLVGNFVGFKVSPLEAVPGILILIIIAFIGILLSKIIPIKIPSVAYIVTLATILTIPGIYTGKNLDTLKKTGWKIFILALFVMLGTYLGSAIIAQVILKMLGQI